MPIERGRFDILDIEFKSRQQGGETAPAVRVRVGSKGVEPAAGHRSGDTWLEDRTKNGPIRPVGMADTADSSRVYLGDRFQEFRQLPYLDTARNPARNPRPGYMIHRGARKVTPSDQPGEPGRQGPISTSHRRRREAGTPLIGQKRLHILRPRRPRNASLIHPGQEAGNHLFVPGHSTRRATRCKARR